MTLVKSVVHLTEQLPLKVDANTFYPSCGGHFRSYLFLRFENFIGLAPKKQSLGERSKVKGKIQSLGERYKG